MATLYKAGGITVYIEDPLAGLVVGFLVGLLQRKRPILIAVLCLVPDVLLRFAMASDDLRFWASSPGLVRHVLYDSLPFLAATIGALVTSQLVLRKAAASPGVPA